MSPRSPYLAWADIGLTLGGAIYTGGLLGYAPLLATLNETPTQGGGQAWMLLAMVTLWNCSRSDRAHSPLSLLESAAL